MPELRARSRTPSTSRGSGGQASPSSSPRKGASSESCLTSWCSKICPCPSKLTAQRRQQLITGGWFLAAILIAAGGICTVHHRVDVKLPINSLTERLAFTLRVLLFAGVTLAASVKYVAFKRFTSGAINPLSGNDRAVDVPNRILQNTLEQFVLHSCTLLALATYLSAEQMKFIPLLVLYFVLGRVLFFLGYPSKRCFGFALGWLSSGIAAWATFYFMYTRGLVAF